jgi:hypothetical protein
LSVVHLRVHKEGERQAERTARLLAEAAKRLHKEGLTPKDGQVPIFFSDATAGEAWDVVEKALDEADAGWRELVTIEPRRE